MMYILIPILCIMFVLILLIIADRPHTDSYIYNSEFRVIKREGKFIPQIKTARYILRKKRWHTFVYKEDFYKAKKFTDWVLHPTEDSDVCSRNTEDAALRFINKFRDNFKPNTPIDLEGEDVITFDLKDGKYVKKWEFDEHETRRLMEEARQLIESKNDPPIHAPHPQKKC